MKLNTDGIPPTMQSCFRRVFHGRAVTAITDAEAMARRQSIMHQLLVYKVVLIGDVGEVNPLNYGRKSRAQTDKKKWGATFFCPYK